EPFFPNYYKLPEKKLSVNKPQAVINDEQPEPYNPMGRVEEVVNTVSSSIKAGKSDFLGVIVCGWADAGLNPETFWLGYATGCAAAWNLGSVNIQDLSNRFYNSFYGNKTIDMDRVYQLLSTQAEFWKDSWEWETSQNRTPIFGYSAGIYDTPKPAKDQTLPYLPVPSGADMSINKDWNNINKERLELAEKFLQENNELLNLLQQNLVNVDYQHYNLQVLLSVAVLCRQNLNMLTGLKRINDLLNLSSTLAATDAALAVSLVDQALDQAKDILTKRNEVLQEVTIIWYQDWYPRVSEANGRKFLDQVDDVKDHPPVRTIDMSYLIYRELKYPLGKWAEEVVKVRNEFAKRNSLPVTTESLNWQNIKN
ncbi:MAG: glycoside hydrolase, partial [Ginsengibacter sp.]